MMKKAYKSELDPNNKRVTSMRRHVGAARWAYKWGIERIKQVADEGEQWPSAVCLHREGNRLKRWIEGSIQLPRIGVVRLTAVSTIL